MRFSVLVLFLLAGCGAPMMAGQQGPASPPLSPLAAVAALPADLSGFRRSGPPIDYEQAPNGAGLGASVRYVPANGEKIVATVYIYTRGRPHRPEGGSSGDVAQELRSTAEEVNALTRIGRYRSAAFEAGMDVGPLPSPDSIRCATFRVVQPDGTPTGDAVCIAVQDGRFVKTRVTTWVSPAPSAAGIIAAGLLDSVRKARTDRQDLRATLSPVLVQASAPG